MEMHTFYKIDPKTNIEKPLTPFVVSYKAELPVTRKSKALKF